MAYSPANIRLTAPRQTSEPEVDAALIVDPADTDDRTVYLRDLNMIDQEIETSGLTLQQMDARRSLPRARTDNLNPTAGYKLSEPGEEITAPSLWHHRKNRRDANRGIAKFDHIKVRREAVEGFLNTADADRRQYFDDLNVALESGEDPRTSPRLARSAKTHIKQLDAAIAAVESENTWNHVVYTPVRVPESLSREDFLNAFRNTEGSDAKRSTTTLLGYTRATHDATSLVTDDNDEIVIQMETARGMYLADGDNKGGHLLPRGIQLTPVGVSEHEVRMPDGSTKTRTYIQMRELPREERTAARK